ncbi:MAG: endonuclease [Paludibacteraceae bacterium]|nr:endonuclease [Paludibacteraceae bacterium]
MKQHLWLLVCAMLATGTLTARPKAGHYAELDGKKGTSLFAAASACAGKGYSSLGYDGLYKAYEKTDNKDGKVWDMYSNCTFGFSDYGTYKKECDHYNREHSVPQSWWGKGTSNQGCDIFHVIPTDGYVNNWRGNDPYGEVSTAKKTSTNGCKSGPSGFSGYTGNVFEPTDEYKGDIARGIMGAMVKWQGKWTQGQGDAVFTGNYTDAKLGFTQYAIDLFMKWHRQDPVSRKELDRNDGIEATQGNRNPFIDYPELAEYLWGTKRGEAWSGGTAVCAYDGVAAEPAIAYPYNGLSLSAGRCEKDARQTLTITVRAYNLKSGISLALSGADAGFFTVSPSSLTADQANSGHDVAIIYAPTAEGDHTAVLTLTCEDLQPVQVTLTATCGQQGQPGTDIPEGDYEKITTEPVDWNGIYLIIYEDESVALDGAKADASGRTLASADARIKVTIVDGVVKTSQAVDAAALTLEQTPAGCTFKTSNGYYMGISENSNTINTSTDPILCSVSMRGGEVSINGTGSLSERTLRFNTQSHQFRFYTSGQKAVQLYRKAVKPVSTLQSMDTLQYDVQTAGGMLLLQLTEPAEVAVYDLTGRVLVTPQRTDRLQTVLPTGIWLIRINGNVLKVAAR